MNDQELEERHYTRQGKAGRPVAAGSPGFISMSLQLRRPFHEVKVPVMLLDAHSDDVAMKYAYSRSLLATLRSQWCDSVLLHATDILFSRSLLLR